MDNKTLAEMGEEMKPCYQDHHVTVYNKDCRNMNELPDNSVQCVVTSPPYWGLRKYSGEQEIAEWGCSYGLEPTPEMYAQHTIEILREIRRVLRKDGVVFWNIGDSYASNGIYIEKYKQKHPEHQDFHTKHSERYENRKGYRGGSIKAKDLCLIPFRIAISAQTDGWWVRSVIIWNKPNPMPESVKDRPTESHEYILMLTKNARYHWDQEAVREPNLGAPFKGKTYDYKNDEDTTGGLSVYRNTPNYQNPAGRNLRSVWTFPTQPYPEAHFAVFPEKLPELCIKAASRPEDIILDPFMGSGTTLWVAKKLGRQAIGYELSEEYCKLALERNRQQVLI